MTSPGEIGSNGTDELAVRLERHVEMLAETIGERNVFRPEALAEAEAYIADQWLAMGYDVDSQTYEVRGIACSNLEVNRTGNRGSGDIMLVGAHYDSVFGSPGANDNGSGVAVLLEMARWFAAVDVDRTVRFVAFTNEEPPFFLGEEMGSMRYARAVKDRGDKIALMLALETIGCYSDQPGSQDYPPLFRWFYPDSGNFIAFVSNFRSRRSMRRFAAAFRQHSDFPAEEVATFAWIPGVAWSDHQSFWRYGYPALMATDTAFYRYPYYHTAMDKAHHLDYAAMASLAEGLEGAVLSLVMAR